VKIGIVGPGALGCLFAGMLSRTRGNEVWLLDYRPERARLLRSRGLTVTGLTRIRVPPSRLNVTAHPRRAGIMDLLIVLVKSFATADAIRKVGPCLRGGPLLATFQNGLNNEGAIRKALGRRMIKGVLCGTTAHGATLLGPGRIRHAGRGDTFIGADSPAERRTALMLRGILNRAGLRAQVVGGKARLLWSKVVINSAMNPLGTVLGVPNGELIEEERARRLLRATAEESAKVARAAGMRLLFADPGRKVEEVCAATSANYNSMLQDFSAGRRTEIGEINGAVVREARKLGISAPLNEAFLRALSQTG
jgi:2-dehydropantoate 2-reductase